MQNFTEIVPGEPLRRGVKCKRGSKIAMSRSGPSCPDEYLVVLGSLRKTTCKLLFYFFSANTNKQFIRGIVSYTSMCMRVTAVVKV